MLAVYIDYLQNKYMGWPLTEDLRLQIKFQIIEFIRSIGDRPEYYSILVHNKVGQLFIEINYRY